MFSLTLRQTEPGWTLSFEGYEEEGGLTRHHNYQFLGNKVELKISILNMKRIKSVNFMKTESLQRFTGI